MCERHLFPITGALLEALKHGDERAWERVIVQESPCLKAWLRRRIPTWLQEQQPEQRALGGGIVGDVAQDTWVIVYSSVVGNSYMSELRHGYVHPPVKSPIGRVPRSAGEFALRGRLRWEQRQVDRPVGAVDADYDPVAAIETRAPDAGVADLLDTIKPPLNEQERNILKLRFELGQTHEEIGNTVGMPLATVYGLYCRAMQKIAEHLIREESAGRGFDV